MTTSSATASAAAGRRTRRRLLRAATGTALGAAGALGTACSTGRQETGALPPAGKLRADVTVQAMTAINTAEQGPLDEAARRWRTANPSGPLIELINAGSGSGKLEAAIAAGSPPDAVALDGATAIGFADRGQLVALDPYIKRDKYDLGDYFGTGITQYQWKGKQHGLPRGQSNRPLFYNQTLFDEAGIKYPPNQFSAGGWDFDEFLKAAERLTKRTAEGTAQYGFVLARALRGGWGQWVWTNGAEIFDKDYTTCTLDDARAIEALQFMQDLMYKYRVAPTPPEEQAAGNADRLFYDGKAAMSVRAASDENMLKVTYKWDLAVNAKGKGKRLTTGGGTGWLMPAGTGRPEEGWALMKHLTSPETARLLAAIFYPPRKTVLQQYLAADPQQPPKSRNVPLDGQNEIHLDPLFPYWTEIDRDVVTPELNALWRNEKTAKQAMDVVVPKVNDLLKRKRAG